MSRTCRLFGVSRQSIYQQEARCLEREKELLIVRQLVEKQRRLMPRLGVRKLYFLLEQSFVENGIKIGRDAFFAYLKREQMLVKPMKNYTKTTFSKHWLRKYPNLFKDIDVNRTEQVFVSDITYIKSNERTHYLSLVTDVFSRKIVGYHLSDDMSAENVVKALKMAVKNRKTNLQLIHHSDRGLQYCSQIYQNELNKNNIIASMTDGYDCYQNALAERINGILKQEFLIYKCKSGNELNQLIKESVECYNTKRPHLSLNMKTPNFVYEKTSEVNFTGFN
jgi:transposase InsO family protein